MLKQAIIVATAALVLIPVAASAGEVQNRVNHEQARIDQGAASGRLNAGEYSRLDGRLDQIEWQRDRDLRADDGRLTGVQYARLNHEENDLSRRISFDKHTFPN